MQRLDLNLSSRPFRNNTLLWTGYGVAAAALLAFTIWNATTYTRHRALLSEKRSHLEDLAAQQADLDRRERLAERERDQTELDLDRLTVQAMKANDVIEWKAFSWTELFNRLETVLPWDVYMSAVRPIFQTEKGRVAASAPGVRSRVVAVEGYAKSLKAMLEFERRLFASEYFDDPEPLRHAPDERGELVFTMRFTYYPDGRPRDQVLEAVQETAPAGAADGEGGDVAARSAADDPGGAVDATPPAATGEDGAPSILDEAKPAPTIQRAGDRDKPAGNPAAKGDDQRNQP